MIFKKKLWLPKEKEGKVFDEIERSEKDKHLLEFEKSIQELTEEDIIDLEKDEVDRIIKEEEKIRRKEEEIRRKEEEKRKFMSNPLTIKEQIDRYVIGQEEAKKDLSIAFAEMFGSNATNNSCYQRSNILMLGPTGVGKTKLLETLAQVFDMPLEIIKVGRMVQPGIVGKTFSQVFQNLKKKLNKKEGKCDPYANPFLMPMFGFREEKVSKHNAIVYIDEIDKLCFNGRYRTNIYGDALQDELISLMDPTITEGVDTSKILFVGGGAFEGIKELVGTNKDGTKIGFERDISANKSGSDFRYVDENTLESALEKYGMKKELIGRFPVRTILHPLNEENLVNILTKAEDSVIKTTTEFYKNTKDVTITFDPEAIKYIAKTALKRGTGARALNGVVEKVLKPYKFPIENYRGQEIKITVDDVQRAL